MPTTLAAGHALSASAQGLCKSMRATEAYMDGEWVNGEEAKGENASTEITF